MRFGQLATLPSTPAVKLPKPLPSSSASDRTKVRRHEVRSRRVHVTFAGKAERVQAATASVDHEAKQRGSSRISTASRGVGQGHCSEDRPPPWPQVRRLLQ